jgi:hypothetical protein
MNTKLRTEVAQFAGTKPRLPDVIQHLASRGFQVSSNEMLAAWLNQQGICVEVAQSEWKPRNTSFRSGERT